MTPILPCYMYNNIGINFASALMSTFNPLFCFTGITPYQFLSSMPQFNPSLFMNHSNSSGNATVNNSSANNSSSIDVGTINTKGILVKGKGKGTGYGPEFLAKVKKIAQNVNCDYRDLLGLMYSESRIDSKIKCPKGSASGLIQFTSDTAKGLGTTTAALRAMTPIQQLDYVEKFLLKNKKYAGVSSSGRLSAGDLYAIVFLPGRAKRDVLTTSTESYYKWNPGLDLNKDGKITKAELASRVKSKHVSDNSFLA